ncbi:MAG TPA: SWIM zinc finger family protein [Thermodesulfobacteriota bacterium]
MGRWDYFGFFKPSRPRAVEGGIRSQSKGSRFGESWWAKRWISTLESFNIGARLGRGRTYARSGQVLSIEIDKGQVGAKVQGSRPKPYAVTIQMKTLSSSDWQKLTRELSHQAIFTAKLLSGEMPQDVEKIFKDAGLSLFPEKLKDLKTECSCPDWSNPCKHIAAVFYLLGEEFDRDPFLIFKLRGISREEFLGLLGPRAGKKPSRGRKAEAMPAQEAGDKTPPAEAFIADIPAFWDGQKVPDNLFGEVHLPPVSAALPKRLGSFPFWRAEMKFLEAMGWIYFRAAARGLDLFLGTDPFLHPPENSQSANPDSDPVRK